MRILMLSPSLSSRMGGSISSVLSLASSLSQEHEVTVWATNHEEEYIDERGLKNCQVRLFDLALESFFLAPAMLPALMRERNRFDTVNVFHFWTMTGLVGALLSPATDGPVFLHTQGILMPVALKHHRTRKKLAWLLGGQQLINRFAAVIACTKAEVVGIREWGFKKAIHVLPNAVQPVCAERGVIRRRLGLLEDNKIVAYLNRFDPIKRVVELCDACRIVQDRCKKAVFVFAGDVSGGYGDKVLAHAKDIGLRVTFLGRLGPEEKWNLLADADILCQYSEQEGHSNALIEAISVGVPVVISRGCNFEQIAKDSAGFIVDSTQEMADAATALLMDSDLRKQLSANALRLSEQYRDNEIRGIYVSIVNAHQRQAAL